LVFNFPVPDEDSVTVHVRFVHTQRMRSHEDVGQILWPASIALSRFIIGNRCASVLGACVPRHTTSRNRPAPSHPHGPYRTRIRV
jgi:hypothetical protein